MAGLSVAQIDDLLGQARQIIAIQRGRGNKLGAAATLREVDRLLDQRLVATGPPVCAMPLCGRVKSRFGTSAYLCPECDFPTCQIAGCDRKTLALTNDMCSSCRAA